MRPQGRPVCFGVWVGAGRRGCVCAAGHHMHGRRHWIVMPGGSTKCHVPDAQALGQDHRRFTHAGMAVSSTAWQANDDSLMTDDGLMTGYNGLALYCLLYCRTLDIAQCHYLSGPIRIVDEVGGRRLLRGSCVSAGCMLCEGGGWPAGLVMVGGGGCA